MLHNQGDKQQQHLSYLSPVHAKPKRTNGLGRGDAEITSPISLAYLAAEPVAAFVVPEARESLNLAQ